MSEALARPQKNPRLSPGAKAAVVAGVAGLAGVVVFLAVRRKAKAAEPSKTGEGAPTPPPGAVPPPPSGGSGGGGGSKPSWMLDPSEKADALDILEGLGYPRTEGKSSSTGAWQFQSDYNQVAPAMGKSTISVDGIIGKQTYGALKNAHEWADEMAALPELPAAVVDVKTAWQYLVENSGAPLA